MIVLFSKQEECLGCSACKSICPTNAIKMKKDQEGFEYPSINHEICIECKQCLNVCPINNEVIHENEFSSSARFRDPIVYAVKHKSNNARMKSTSGGVFTALSDYGLLKNKVQSSKKINISNNIDKIIMRDESTESYSKYVVFGAKFDNEFNVYHDEAKTIEKRNEFRESKYVQSSIGDSFVKIKNYLLNGKKVMFSGTPCQVAGLKLYIEEINKKNPAIDLLENLIMTDIICHGTPSPTIWKDFVRYIQDKHRQRLVSFTFRNKNKGWKSYSVKATFTNQKERTDNADIMIFTKLFFSLLAHRPSCYKCKFTNLSRPSDLTMGDFWGLEKTLATFEDTAGVSLLLVNTKKGHELFSNIKDDIIFIQSNTTDCIQHNLMKPNAQPNLRGEFWSDYFEYGFLYIAKKYGGYNIVGRLRRIIINILKTTGLFSLIKK